MQTAVTIYDVHTRCALTDQTPHQGPPSPRRRLALSLVPTATITRLFSRVCLQLNSSWGRVRGVHESKHGIPYVWPCFSGRFSPGDRRAKAARNFETDRICFICINQKPKDFEPPAERPQTTKKAG